MLHWHSKLAAVALVALAVSSAFGGVCFQFGFHW
jgi:hypothetical protein